MVLSPILRCLAKKNDPTACVAPNCTLGPFRETPCVSSFSRVSLTTSSLGTRSTHISDTRNDNHLPLFTHIITFMFNPPSDLTKGDGAHFTDGETRT